VILIAVISVGMSMDMKIKQNTKRKYIEQYQLWKHENTELKAEVQRLKLEIEIRDKYEEVPVLTEGK
jgi:predicted transglutaminase-like protease